MLAILRPAVVLTVLLTALTGIAYPLAVTGVAQLAMPNAANGSLVRRAGVVVGSELIGQTFGADRYFQGRPSATTAPDPADRTKTVDRPYNAAASGGSNLGPTSAALIEAIRGRVAALGSGVQPADLVTTSASGLDPDISPAAALAQVPRVAAARGQSPERVRALVQRLTRQPTLGFVGEPAVNVLALNLALDGSGTP